MQIIFCTCPDKKTAHHIARTLIEKKLAACVNIVPRITSVYSWQGSIETTDEYVVLLYKV
jgi:periplasmic divalent cation tolerance protein